MANCKNCKDNEQIPEQSKDELAFAFAERMVKRLWIAVIVAIVLLFASSAIFTWAWMQYDYESYEITADDDSNANYIGQDGNIYNGGIGESEETNPEE